MADTATTGSIRIRIEKDIADAISNRLPSDVRIVYDDSGQAFLDGNASEIRAILEQADVTILETLNMALLETDSHKISGRTGVTADQQAESDGSAASRAIDFLSTQDLPGVLAVTPLDTLVGTGTAVLGQTQISYAEQVYVNQLPNWVGPNPLQLDLTQDSGFSYNPFKWFQDPEGHEVYLNFEVDGSTALPGWMQFNAATGLLGGTPTNDDVGQHTLRITFSDGKRASEVTLNVTVANINDAPNAAVDVDTGANFVSENAANGTLVGITAKGSDIDVGTVVHYTLADNAGGRFAIDYNTGVVTVANGALLNFEANTSHTIVVRTSDGELYTDSTFTITLGDVNETPTLSDAIYSIAENTGIVTWLGEPDVTDPDAGDTKTWTIVSGNDDNLFVVSAGNVILISPPNFEAQTVYNLVVRITDSGGLSDTATITINILDVNEAPVASDAAFTVAENTAPGHILGNLVSTDVDAGDTRTWTIVSGNGAGLFSLSPTGELTLAGSPNFEAAGTHTLTVRVTDAGGLTSDSTVTVTITDVNETPVADSATFTVAENTAAGHVLGQLTGSDVDAGDTHTWSIVSGNTGNMFALSPAGELTLADTPNFEAAGTYTLTVRMTDAGGLHNDSTVTVTITDVNETPVADNAAFTVAENTASGHVLGNLTASDVDAGDTKTWSIVSGNTGNMFALSPSGELTLAGSPNFEGVNSYTLTVRVTDSGGLTSDSTVTVTVTDVNETPVADNASFTVAENTVSGHVLGDLTASDVDAGDTKIWSIVSGNTGNMFALSPSGQLTLAGSPNFEGTNSYTLTVRVTDSGGLTSDSTVTVTVTDVNEAPVADSATFSVAENSAIGTSVGTVTASDVDAGDTRTFAITGGNGAGMFAISSTTGEITLAGSPNFEGTSSYTLTVRVTDAGGLTSDSTVTVNVTNVNEAPTAFNGSFTVAENSAPGTALGVLSSSDPDAGDTRTWSIVSGNTGNMFALSPSGGLSLAGTPNFEGTNSYTLTVRVTDAGGLTSDSTVTVNVTNVNEAPVASNATFSIAENSAIGTAVGIVTATDVDAGDTRTFAITGGNGAGMFAISSTTGQITLAGSPNFEGTNSYTLTVRVTDAGGLTSDSTVTVNVTNVNEAPVASNATFSIAENSAIGTAVGIVTATDVDAGDTRTFAITGGNGAGMFAISSTTGEITLAGSPNFEGTNSYTLTVRVTDAGGLTSNATVTVNVTNVNEAPVANNATFTIAENSAIGANVGTVTATDVDAGDTRTFSIVGGNGAGIFTISSGGQITLAASPNYEVASSYTLTVRATDAGGLHHDATVTVNITDVNEAPTNILLSSTTVNENSAVGTTIGTLSATDDAGSSHTFTIIADPDNKFAIVGNELKVNGILNYENFSSHSVTVRVSDGTYTYNKTFTIGVNNINDIPVVANQTFQVAENSAGGTLLVRSNGQPHLNRVTGFDEDGNTLTWSITSGNAAGYFQINAATGELSVKAGANLNFEGTASYTLGITANDGTANSAEGFITVNLTNVNEAPNAPDAALTVYSGAASGTLVSTLSATDPDAGDTRTWTILSGNTNNLFSLSSSGQLTLNAMPSSYGTMSYALVVKTTDAGGLSDNATITVTISNVNNPPVVNAPATASGSEDTNLVITGVTFSDADIGQTYSLTLSVNTGVLTLNTGIAGGLTAGNIANNGTGTVTITGASLAQLTNTFNGNGLVYRMPLNQSGTATLNYTLNDGVVNATDSQVITIAPVNDAPVAVNTIPVQSIESDDTWSYQFNTNVFNDVDGDTLTYTAKLASGAALPSFIQFNAATRTFSVPSIPGESNIGSYTIYVYATDPGGLSTYQSLTLNVTAQGLTAPTNGDTAIQGGSSANVITGGEGNDSLYGSYAAGDTIYGRGGNDFIRADTNTTGALGGYNNDIVYGGDGNDTIYGDHPDFNVNINQGHDKLYGEAGDDIIYGMTGDDLIDGGDGNDNLRGGFGNDTVYGGTGNDIIYGDGGNDIIYGDDGDDIIYGGAGKDTLTGGAGADTFGYSSHDESPNALNFDTITDFQIGIDKISVGIFTGIVNGVGQASGTILEWYQTGSGPTAKTIITSDQVTYKFYLELTGHINLSATDFNFVGIYGTNGNDTLYGTGDNDTIIGQAGDDYIDARQGGIDQIFGGTGNDTIYMNGNGSVAYGEDGNDTIYSYALATVYGGAGNDVIYTWRKVNAWGGEGADTYMIIQPRLMRNDYANGAFIIEDFDLAEDKLDFSLMGVNGFYFGGFDISRVDKLTITYNAAQDITHIQDNELHENGSMDIMLRGNYATNSNAALNLSAANFVFGAITDGSAGDTDARAGYVAGNSAANGFLGTAGNDVFYLGAGGDNVSTMGGDDLVMARMDGNEYDIHLGLGENRAFLIGSGAAFMDTRELGNNHIIATGNARIYINAQSGGTDFIKGAGANDVINGGAGDDIIYADRGDDTYVRGGAGNDYVDAGEGNDRYLFEGGTGNDIVIGGMGSDYMWGDSFNGSGNQGADTFIIFDPRESLSSNPDVIFDFDATDKLQLYGFTGIGTGATELTITTYVETKLGYVSATWVDITNAATGFGITLKTTQTITVGGNLILSGATLGTSGNDTMNGTSGHDYLMGMQGNDTINGGNGNDTIFGGEGNDTLNGQDGNDTLWGSYGNDILSGGLGADVLWGGSGADTFKFATGESTTSVTDQIWDFKTGNDADKLDLSGVDVNHVLTFADLVFETPDITGGDFTRISVTTHGYNFAVNLLGWYEKGIDITASDVVF